MAITQCVFWVSRTVVSVILSFALSPYNLVLAVPPDANSFIKIGVSGELNPTTPTGCSASFAEFNQFGVATGSAVVPSVNASVNISGASNSPNNPQGNLRFYLESNDASFQAPFVFILAGGFHTWTTPDGNPRNVEFTTHLDGVITQNSNSNRIKVDYTVRIVDVTNFNDNIFSNICSLDPQTTSREFSAFSSPLSEFQTLASVLINGPNGPEFALDQQQYADLNAAGSNQYVFYGGSNFIQNVSVPSTVTYQVEDGHTYYIAYTLTALEQYMGDGTTILDFSSTATFEYSNLNGATYLSESGLFLSGLNTMNIPFPAWAITMLALILLGGTAFRRRKK